MAMCKVTLSAEKTLLQEAQRRAALEKTTLDVLFQTWLQQYTVRFAPDEQYTHLMARLAHVQSGRKFSRDEMNDFTA